MNNANKLNDKYNKAQKLNIETDTANTAFFIHTLHFFNNFSTILQPGNNFHNELQI